VEECYLDLGLSMKESWSARLLVLSSTRTLVRSSACSLLRSFVRPPVRSYARSLVRLSAWSARVVDCLSACPLVRSFARMLLSAFSLLCSYNGPLVHSLLLAAGRAHHTIQFVGWLKVKEMTKMRGEIADCCIWYGALVYLEGSKAKYWIYWALCVRGRAV